MDTSNHPMHNSYLQFNDPGSNNADFNNFINGVQLAATDSIDPDAQFDPALFEGSDLNAPYTNRAPGPPPNSAYTQRAQAVPQSQSPALPHFNPSLAPYSGQQYGSHGRPASLHEQRPSASPFDNSILSRPTPSPGPYDQYPFRQTSEYSNHQQTTFDPRFNSFSEPGRTQSPTPLQAFRGQTSQNTNQPGSISRGQQHQYMHPQGAHLINYAYPNHASINPSMLTANESFVGLQQNLPPLRPGGPASYFAPPSMGMDPRLLQNPMYSTQGPGQPAMAAVSPQALRQGYLPGPHQGQFQDATRPPVMHGVSPVPIKPRPTKPGPNGTEKSASTDDDLEIDEEEPEVKPAFLSITKPTDDRGKLLWEVMDAVWTPRNKPADPDKIRSGIKFVGDTVRMLRDKWKAQNERLKQAELPASNTAASVDALKAATTNSRELMETLVIRITRFGHPSILRRLGENQFTLSALYSFLLDRVNAEDYDSKLITAILELGTHLETVDEEQLEKVKWSKVLTRISKRSTTAAKGAALKIVDNAKQATLRKKNNPTSAMSTSSGSGANGQTPGSMAGVKRSREGSEPSQQVKKPAVRPSSKPLSLQIEERRRREKAAAKEAKMMVKPAMDTTPAVPAVNKPKSVAVAPKISPFASLLSASKKPGTSMAERAAAATTGPRPQTEPSASTGSILPEPAHAGLTKQSVVHQPAVLENGTAVTSAASFLGFLADVDKPKVAPVKAPVVDSSESPEARAKRLRKEKRRQLRVSWKMDDELVQTRIFEHDIEEEIGHDDSMVRDVGDSGKEGEMLKRHVDIDDDDSDDEEQQEEFYFAPTEVAFDFPEGTMAYVKTGGGDMPESESKAAQDQYEQGKLMTVWSASRQQPSSPQEPSGDEEEETFEPCRDFGEPAQPHVRQREQSYMARTRPYQAPQPPPQSAPVQDLSALLANIQAQTRASTVSQDQQPSFDASQHGQLPLPLPPPLLAGFHGVDFNALLAAQQGFHGSSSTSLPPPPPPPPSSALSQQVPTAIPGVTPDIQALLASFAQNSTASSNPSQLTGSGNPNAMPLGMGSNKSSMFSGMSMYPTDLDGHNKKEKKKGSKVPIDEKTGLPLNYKTQVCTYWLEGKCAKGEACTYKHERE